MIFSRRQRFKIEQKSKKNSKLEVTIGFRSQELAMMSILEATKTILEAKIAILEAKRPILEAKIAKIISDVDFLEGSVAWAKPLNFSGRCRVVGKPGGQSACVEYTTSRGEAVGRTSLASSFHCSQGGCEPQPGKGPKTWPGNI